MWKENDKIINLLNESTLLSSPYPQKCPECNKESVHVYLHRFDEQDEIGAAWIWCSECHSYSHVRYKIPSVWKNCNSIDEEQLDSIPEYLDQHSKNIDQHVNQFIRND